MTRRYRSLAPNHLSPGYDLVPPTGCIFGFWILLALVVAIGAGLSGKVPWF